MNPTMPAQTLYLDTSVIGGYYDAKFLADTRALWRLREAGRFRSEKLSWSETGRAMAAAAEGWSDWDAASGDGLDLVKALRGPFPLPSFVGLDLWSIPVERSSKGTDQRSGPTR